MDNIKLEIIEQLARLTDIPVEELAPLVERPPDPGKGDYALACFRLGKKLQKSPPQIAAFIAANVPPTGLISRVEATGGYVNFFLDPVKIIPRVINRILSAPEEFGASDIGQGKTVVIDYSSPNIAKPMGIGHLRSTVIGHALYNIYDALGYKCVGINYLGDWGTQFGMLIADYKQNSYAHFSTINLAERYVAYNEKAKANPDLLEKARLEFKRLEEGDQTNLNLWRTFRGFSIKEFQRIYDLLGLTFDEYSGEADTNRYVKDIIAEIEKKGLTEVSEGALIVNLKEYGMPPCLLRKSDGATLYAARDIAAAIHRYEKYRFHKLIYVVGSDQKLHFRQMFKVLELMGYPWAKDCVHVDFGLVRMGGEKMSTRAGKTIMLEEVLQEAIDRSHRIMNDRTSELADKVSADDIQAVANGVGIGAIIFNDLKNRRTRDIDFNWDQVLAFDGETGPYLQYSHTRLASLLAKAREAGYEIGDEGSGHYELLKADEEITLLKRLNDFPEVLEQAAQEFEPSLISNYLLEMASLFNRYYRFQRIISSVEGEQSLTRARLTLVHCLKYVLARGLTLLGMVPLERM